MQNGSVKIVNTDGIFHDGMSEVIGFAIAGAPFDPAACHPTGERLHVVVAPRIVIPDNLGGRSAPKLAAVDYKRRVEETALFQITQQSGDGFVGAFASHAVIVV